VNSPRLIWTFRPYRDMPGGGYGGAVDADSL